MGEMPINTKTYIRNPLYVKRRRLAIVVGYIFLTVFNVVLILSLKPNVIGFALFFNLALLLMFKCHRVKFPLEVAFLENHVDFICEDGKIYQFYKSKPATVCTNNSELGGTGFFLKQDDTSIDLDENFYDYKSLTQDLVSMWPDLRKRLL